MRAFWSWPPVRWNSTLVTFETLSIAVAPSHCDPARWAPSCGASRLVTGFAKKTLGVQLTRHWLGPFSWTAKWRTSPVLTLTWSRSEAMPTPSVAASVFGPQIGVAELLIVTSAVAPAAHPVSVIKTCPLTLTSPDPGAVQLRATQDVGAAGGSSSKLLTNPEVVPFICHSWSS